MPVSTSSSCPTGRWARRRARRIRTICSWNASSQPCDDVDVMTPEECLIIYGQAWFERDRQQRIDVLRRCCTEDVVFMDPQLGRLEGLEAVADMIRRYAAT